MANESGPIPPHRELNDSELAFAAMWDAVESVQKEARIFRERLAKDAEPYTMHNSCKYLLTSIDQAEAKINLAVDMGLEDDAIAHCRQLVKEVIVSEPVVVERRTLALETAMYATREVILMPRFNAGVQAAFGNLGTRCAEVRGAIRSLWFSPPDMEKGMDFLSGETGRQLAVPILEQLTLMEQATEFNEAFERVHGEFLIYFSNVRHILEGTRLLEELRERARGIEKRAYFPAIEYALQQMEARRPVSWLPADDEPTISMWERFDMETVHVTRSIGKVWSKGVWYGSDEMSQLMRRAKALGDRASIGALENVLRRLRPLEKRTDFGDGIGQEMDVLSALVVKMRNIASDMPECGELRDRYFDLVVKVDAWRREREK